MQPDGVEMPLPGEDGDGARQWWGRRAARWVKENVDCDACDACDGCDSCDGCDGCGGCDLLVFRVSTLLFLASAVLPEVGTGALVRAAIRGYRRWLTRFTATCPSTPSCSAYALAAVESLGPRRGLAAAARRVRACTPQPGADPSSRPTIRST